MAKRGRKTVNRTGWLQAGGPLPEKAPEALSKEERVYYRWLLAALTAVGVGGKVDLQGVILCCRILARADTWRAVIDGLESPVIARETGPAVHPAYGELARTEARIREMLISLNLMPRTRSASRLPAETQAAAAASSEPQNAILRLLGG